jgi:tetratricopeptide (TPR) repeat protein
MTLKLDLKVREILIWPLLEGRLITAGIVGPHARFRYLLLTPALLNILNEDELRGVVAHETGHVKYNHLWYYLFYFTGILVCGLAIYFMLTRLALIWWQTAYPLAASSEWAGTAVSVFLTLGMGLILFGGFRLLFGKLSRAFERQADLYAIEALNDPAPVAKALTAISAHSGKIDDIPSWHHGSVGERVRFIYDAGNDPALIRAHHKIIRKMKRIITISVVVLFCGAIYLNLPEVNKDLRVLALLTGLETRVEHNPSDVIGWSALGSIRLDRGFEALALKAFERAIELTPPEAEAYNGAAWLLATTNNNELLDPERAVELALMALKINPAPHILDTLSEALYQNGDYPDALKAIEKVLSLTDPASKSYLIFEERREKILLKLR